MEQITAQYGMILAGMIGLVGVSIVGMITTSIIEWWQDRKFQQEPPLDELQNFALQHRAETWIEDGQLFVAKKRFNGRTKIHQVRTAKELLIILGY